MKVLGLLWTEILLSTMYGNDKIRNGKNLIQTNSEKQEWMPVNTMISASKAHCRIRKQWKYDPSKLRGICTTFEHDKLWKSLPFGTVRRIRELRLNQKPKRKHRHREIPPEKRKVCKRNLIPVQLSDNYGNYVSVNFTFGLINARLLRNKCEQIVYYLNSRGLTLQLSLRLG